MIRFIVSRLFVTIPMLLLVLTISFFMISLAPGSPFGSERRLNPEIEANLRAKYGFDQPRWKQYLRFMGNLVGFSYKSSDQDWVWHPYPDFGDSTKFKDRRVNDIIREALPVSAVLGIAAYMVALLVGLIAGVISSMRQNTWLDFGLMGVTMLGISVPNFILGPLLVILFSLTFYFFPPARAEWVYQWGTVRIPSVQSMVLPTLTLSAVYIAYISRLTRSSMLEILRQDYIRTARAKGLPDWRIALNHALRSAILPVVSFTGPALAFLISGTIVVETVFSLPGLGRYFIDAANNRDHFLLLGITAFVSLLLMFFNLLVDIAYAVLDPRIRYR